MSAYDRWKAQLPEGFDGNAHICDEPSDYCRDWVVEHVVNWMNGGYVPYSWRESLAPLARHLPYKKAEKGYV